MKATMLSAQPKSLAIQSIPRGASRARVGQLQQMKKHNSVIVRSISQEQQNEEYILKYPAWEGIQRELTQKYNISSISPQQAKEMVESGKALLVDVRPPQSFEEKRAKGSVNVPAFRVIDVQADQGGGLTSMLRFAVMKFNGVTPTEANPEFPDLMRSVISSQETASVAILMCKQGGSLTPTTTFPSGKVSRSLKACWRLLYNNAMTADQVLHIDGGLQGWEEAGFDME